MGSPGFHSKGDTEKELEAGWLQTSSKNDTTGLFWSFF